MTKKILFYGGLILATILVVFVFITSTNYIQLAIASLLYPPVAYLAFKYFPRRKHPATVGELSSQLPTPNMPENGSGTLVDEDKRAFLKMIGSAGLSFLLFSIFSKKAGPMFFGNGDTPQSLLGDETDVKKSKGDPTEGYQIAEIDETDMVFVGYTNSQGAWFIMKQDSDTGSFRYSRGDADFPENWAKRNDLLYDYFNKTFSE